MAETAAEVVARIEAIPAEARTKGENRELASARNAMRQEARSRPKGQPSDAPPGDASRARAQDGDSTPTDLRAMAETVLRELHASLGELSAYAPKDRASILSLCAKLSGMLDSKEGESVPFTFRGWTQPDVILPAGADPLDCPACHGKGRVEAPTSVAAGG